MQSSYTKHVFFVCWMGLAPGEEGVRVHVRVRMHVRVHVHVCVCAPHSASRGLSPENSCVQALGSGHV